MLRKTIQTVLRRMIILLRRMVSVLWTMISVLRRMMMRRRGGSMGGVVAQREAWRHNGRRGGSKGGVVAQLGGVVAQWEA